jgi:hypothetical protein
MAEDQPARTLTVGSLHQAPVHLLLYRKKCLIAALPTDMMLCRSAVPLFAFLQKHCSEHLDFKNNTALQNSIMCQPGTADSTCCSDTVEPAKTVEIQCSEQQLYYQQVETAPYVRNSVNIVTCSRAKGL